MGPKFNALYNHVFVRFRRRRMRQFFSMFSPSPGMRVVDIGGAVQTWNVEADSHEPFSVTLINNLEYEDFASERFQIIEADATALPLPDNSFDIAFSNSVIEHLGTWERQEAFASEARRVARKLWIQTPARCFPIEAHLLAPYIQYLPKGIQRRVVRWTPRGLLNPGVVQQIVDEVRLLTYAEVAKLFPDCQILRERFCGLTKSYIAVRE
jgi:ubiquinone/menaquinone biosynthesis C-methylase UbiE